MSAWPHDPDSADDVAARARASAGASSEPIYRMVVTELTQRGIRGGTLVDVGCGNGSLARFVKPFIGEYVGVDIVAYDHFPGELRFQKVNLDDAPWPLPEQMADVVTSVETIEHLENPRQHLRQLARLARPGGLIIVTTPNNLSWLSIATLVRKGVFNAFQDQSYPAHIMALVSTDLLRIARECKLVDARIRYSNRGRVPLTARHWPAFLQGRRFSDNLLLSAIREQ